MFHSKTVDVEILSPSAGDPPTINVHFQTSNPFFCFLTLLSLSLSLSLSIPVAVTTLAICWKKIKSHLNGYWNVCRQLGARLF